MGISCGDVVRRWGLFVGCSIDKRSYFGDELPAVDWDWICNLNWIIFDNWIEKL